MRTWSYSVCSWVAVLCLIGVACFRTAGATPCERIMVHGTGYADAGVYTLSSTKLNGLVSYNSPRPSQAYLLYGTADHWQVEEIAWNQITLQIERKGSLYPYNTTEMWTEFSIFGAFPTWRVKVECLDQSLWTRVGICYKYKLDNYGSTNHEWSAQKCLDTCLSVPSCVAFSISRYGCFLHHKHCLHLSLEFSGGFYVPLGGRMGSIQDNKPVYQSSTDSDWDGYAEKATDGIYKGELIESSSCSLTQREVNPWWAINLGKTYLLQGITVVSRYDCCEYTFWDVSIGGDPSSDVTTTLARLAAKDFSDIVVCKEKARHVSLTLGREVIACDIPTIIHTLVIYKRKTDEDFALSICEIEVITDEVGRFGFIDRHTSYTEAEVLCEDFFGKGTLPNMTSQQNLEAVKNFIREETIFAEFHLINQTRPATGLGTDTIYEHGEEAINVATRALGVTCFASSAAGIDTKCGEVFEASDTSWMPKDTTLNSFVKMKFMTYFKIYRVMLLQQNHTSKSFKTFTLEFSEGETFEMTVAEDSKSYFDSMDFDGILSVSLKIEISSVFNNESSGISQVRVFAKPRGMMAFDGHCADQIIASSTKNIGQCEIACLKNLNCKSLTFKKISGQTLKGICNLRSGNCSVIDTTAPIKVVTMVLQDQDMPGYNVFNLTDGCAGTTSLSTTWSSITLSACMQRCEQYAECDNFNFQVEQGITGKCTLIHGPCKYTSYDPALGYKRTGGFFRRTSGTYVGCYPNVPWLARDFIRVGRDIDAPRCQLECSATDATFYAVTSQWVCSCGSTFNENGGELRKCIEPCDSGGGELCGGYNEAHIFYMNAPSSRCTTATSVLPYSTKEEEINLEFKTQLCEKYLPVLCQREVDFCIGAECENNATCTSLEYGYLCSCESGYTGQYCETDIDDCLNSTCFNEATCTDKVNGFSCLCSEGYTGDFCETDIDHCTGAPCANNATCIDGIISYECRCVVGFTGTLCQTEINECLSSPCGSFGICTDSLNNYTCHCNDGFTGSHCETEINECESLPCQNHGTCHDTIDSYFCECSPGVYEGLHCELEVDNCLSNRCLNNGSCESVIKGFICHCAPGYTGWKCESDLDECESMPCENGASCHDEINGYSCTCAVTFEGNNCSQYTGNPSEWEIWGPWSPCSSTCERGIQYRFRNCSGTISWMPPNCPYGNGAETETADCDTGPCPPIDGSWGPWASLTECPNTCEPTTRMSYRECDAPTPQNGGKSCSGENSKISTCIKYCEEDISICEEWQGWSSCKGDCKSASQSRKRLCSQYNMNNKTSELITADEEDVQTCVPKGCSTSGLQCYRCDYKFDGSNLPSKCSTTTGCGVANDQCLIKYSPKASGSVEITSRCGSTEECDNLQPGSPCSNVLSLRNSAIVEEAIATLVNLNETCKICCSSHLCNSGWYIEAEPYYKTSSGPDHRSSRFFTSGLVFVIFHLVYFQVYFTLFS